MLVGARRDLGSQPAGDIVINDSRLPLLSASPAVTFPASPHHCHFVIIKLYSVLLDDRGTYRVGQIFPNI